jgi:UDP-N-acetylglucosamine 4-epimerase
MRVVITGAAGFIASNLAEEMLKQGHDVIGIDNLSTGYVSNVMACRAINTGMFRFFEEDINSPTLHTLMNGAEVVFHLAALARVQYSTDFPIQSNLANVSGTLNVLEACRKAGVRRLVFSSSSSVYGGQRIAFPTHESESLSPKSNYALQKMIGEEYCKMYSNIYGLDTVCLRYFNVFGMRSRLGGAYSALIPVLMNAAVNNGMVTINGDGSICRDYTPVSCVVQANMLAASYSAKLNGEAFNVGLSETRSINELYDLVCSFSGMDIQKVYGPAKKEDPAKSLADIRKIQRVLGYKPDMQFEYALRSTFEWWKNGCK